MSLAFIYLNDKSSFMKNGNLDQIKEAIDIGAKFVGVGIAGGAFLVFLYCFAEGIRPNNLSVSDTITLLYALFSFAVVLAVGIGVGICSSIWLIRLFQWVEKKRNRPNIVKFIWSELDRWYVSSLSILATLILAFFPISADQATEYYHIVAFFYVVGFFFALFYLCDGPKLPAKEAKVYFAIAVFFGTSAIFTPKLLNFTFSVIGIRSAQSDVIQLDEKTQKELAGHFKNIKRRWLACPSADGVHWITTDIKAIWTGFGDTSYVRLIGREEIETRHPIQPLVPVASGGIQLLRGARSVMVC
ncbi:hypothetical protein [Herbaspirillum huttiense]|uniref:hypothetical protein n=1 Tax=Herbaspirillum huttiense TaxID=863372 RepID=UPI0039AF7094